jgi:hypothetical protein
MFNLQQASEQSIVAQSLFKAIVAQSLDEFLVLVVVGSQR